MKRLLPLLLLLASITTAYSGAPPRPDDARTVARGLAAVDSLIANHWMVTADSIAAAHLAHAPLQIFADSIAVLPWIVRRLEMAPYTVPVGTLDSSLARRTLAFSDDVLSSRDADAREVLRLRVAAARSQVLLGDYRGAMTRAASVLRAETSPLPPRVAFDAWIIRARALMLVNAADSARACADSARQVARGSWATPVDRAWADAWLGWVNQRGNRPAEALALLRPSLATLSATTPGADRDLVGMRLSLAVTLVGLGDVRGSAEEYRVLLKALDRAGASETFTYALTLEQLGARERRLGDLVAARDHGEQSVEIMARTVGVRHEDYGFASSILGGALRDLGDLAGAERAARLGVNVVAERLGVLSPRIPEGYNNLAIIYRRMGRLDSALTCIERSRAGYLARPNPRDPERFNTLGTLANVLGDLGRYEETARIADSAAVGMAALMGANHHYVPSILLVQATAERGCGRDSSAIALLDTVIARRLRKYGALHPDVLDAYTERAFTYALMARPGPALRDALEALRIQGEIRRALLRGLDERASLAVILRQRWSVMDIGLTLAAQGACDSTDVAALYDQVVRQRSLLFDELLSRRREGAQDSTSRSQLASLARVRADIASVLLSSGDRTRSNLDSLSRIEERLERTLAAAGSSALRGDQGGLAEVRTALPPHSAMVGFVRYGAVETGKSADRWRPITRPAYAAFVTVSGSPRSRFIDLGDAVVVDSLVSLWASLNAKPARRDLEARLLKVGRSLRVRVFDKVLGASRGAAQVYMVPDGPLSLVDPATLPDASGKFLLEHQERLLRLTCERELLARPPTIHRGTGTLLALGGASFNERSSMETRRGPGPDSVLRFSSCEQLKLRQFGALPGSAAEAEAVAGRWRSQSRGDTSRAAFLLVGASARERAFRASCRGRFAIHVATHGFALHDDCDAWSPEAAAVYRTLYRTGLALAGANERSENSDPSDDGLLTAGEVSALDLSGVSWVCISACESGLGDAVSGEGVQGLVRAFQVAGARQVVMSLWPVSDEAAARWSDSFYSELLEHSMSVSEAARRASMDLLRVRRAAHQPTPPATWACFAVAGVD